MASETTDGFFDDECGVACPVARTARLIEGKWTTLIIRDLMTGKKRYSELQRSLVGISPKVLAERLKFLEDEGLITRKEYPVMQRHTEYELTHLGTHLKGVIAAMAKFSEAR